MKLELNLLYNSLDFDSPLLTSGSGVYSRVPTRGQQEDLSKSLPDRQNGGLDSGDAKFLSLRGIMTGYAQPFTLMMLLINSSGLPANEVKEELMGLREEQEADVPVEVKQKKEGSQADEEPEDDDDSDKKLKRLRQNLKRLEAELGTLMQEKEQSLSVLKLASSSHTGLLVSNRIISTGLLADSGIGVGSGVASKLSESSLEIVFLAIVPTVLGQAVTGFRVASIKVHLADRILEAPSNLWTEHATHPGYEVPVVATQTKALNPAAKPFRPATKHTTPASKVASLAAKTSMISHHISTHSTRSATASTTLAVPFLSNDNRASTSLDIAQRIYSIAIVSLAPLNQPLYDHLLSCQW
ncbi:hypothetical protein F5Y18DRAFT_433178 [Xylariaceae sp. FL1019]|nr:hypothetical protein F5Y18DRAFT_433178 [Xylariaceae sp. FL1019]